MNLSFAIKEALSGFRRAKLSTLVSVLTISLSLVLLGLFAMVTKNGAALVENFRNKVELEAFLNEPIKQSEVDSLRKRIQAIQGVEKVTFVSKEEAARIFKQEFGEDIHKVLDFNPLPPSFKISLREGFRTAERAGEIQKEIQKLKGVNDVVYRKALLEFIDRRVRLFSYLVLGFGILIALSAIFLVSNRMNVTISSKGQIIETMKNVGATPGVMRLPFILEGATHGFLGGVIASVVIYLLVEVAFARLASELTELLSTDFSLYAALIVGGAALGFLGSLFSTWKIIGEWITTSTT